jgi:hypothetical protein
MHCLKGYGTTSDDVTIKSVTNKNSDRRYRQLLGLDNGIIVDYDVSIANVAGFSNVAAAEDALVNNLNTSVTTGAFTSLMRANAAINGGKLSTATSDRSLQIILPTSSPTKKKSSSSSNMRLYIIIGAGIGIVLVLLLLGSFIYSTLSRKTILVSGLPQNYREDDLLVALPGGLIVHRLSSKVSAMVVFESHDSAAELLRKSQRNNAIYFHTCTLTVQWMPRTCAQMFLPCFVDMDVPPTEMRSRSVSGVMRDVLSPVSTNPYEIDDQGMFIYNSDLGSHPTSMSFA